jgi:alpha-tubulin suppressor-like RCC1 family protein
MRKEHILILLCLTLPFLALPMQAKTVIDTVHTIQPKTGTDSTLASMQPLSGIGAIAAGGFHTCALLTTGAVECWGWNGYGQLGDGTTHNRVLPVPVSDIGSVIKLAAGYGHTCALLSDSTVKCWGWNVAGQLGDGTTTNRSTPVSVSGLSGVTDLAAGYLHTCALLNDKTVKCWGGKRFRTTRQQFNY